MTKYYSAIKRIHNSMTNLKNIRLIKRRMWKSIYYRIHLYEVHECTESVYDDRYQKSKRRGLWWGDN